MIINCLTKPELKKKFTDLETKLSIQIRNTILEEINKKEQERLSFEREIKRKEKEMSDKSWNKIKDKNLRLSEIENKIINLEKNHQEFTKSVIEKVNAMVDIFNQHVSEVKK